MDLDLTDIHRLDVCLKRLSPDADVDEQRRN